MSRAQGDARVPPARGLPQEATPEQRRGVEQALGTRGYRRREKPHLPAKVPAGQTECTTLGDLDAERPKKALRKRVLLKLGSRGPSRTAENPEAGPCLGPGNLQLWFIHSADTIPSSNKPKMLLNLKALRERCSRLAL